MSKFGLVILFFLLAGECRAQNYFVLIDAGNRQPFYVRLDSQFYSSSAEGHIILSRLKDSLYDITIGFPGQTALEQYYEFGIRGKDQAFEIRDHDGYAPGLFDLQANEWMKTHAKGSGTDEFRSTGIKKDDAFSRMMAGVVHDTAVLYNTYAMKQMLSDSLALAKKPTPSSAVFAPSTALDTGIARHDTGAAVAAIVSSTVSPDTSGSSAPPALAVGPGTGAAKPDTAVVKAGTGVAEPNTSVAFNPPPVTAPKEPDTATQLHRPITHPPVADTTTLLYRPVAGTNAHKAAPVIDSAGSTPLFRPVAHVTKLSERRSPHSVRLVYADQSQGQKADTIVIIIPVDTVRAALTRSHGPNGNSDSPTLSQNTIFRPLAPAGNPPADNARPANQGDTQRRLTKAAAYVNSDCHHFADDLDVDKLRAKMLEGPKDEDRIAVARKAFKVKCFYTRHIRALGEIFTTDAARYRFFEAAWPFAADEHFHELSNLLADPVYSGKFRALTGHP
jgi:hypothetical protein